MDDKNIHNELFEEPEIKPKLQPRELVRSNYNIVISGVCAGVADYYGWDSGTVRIAFLLSLLLGNWPVVFYAIISLLLPINKSIVELSQEELYSIKRTNFKTVLSGALMLLGLHFTFDKLGLHNSSSILELSGFTFPIMVVIVGIFLLSKNIFDVPYKLNFPVNFTLSKGRKIFLGVCSGFSKYLIVDVVSVRIIFIILSVFTLGLFAVAYIIIGLLLTNKKLISK